MEDQENDQKTVADIDQCLESIFTNLQLNFPIETFETLYQEDIYYEIYDILFPQFSQQIDLIKMDPADTGIKIQKLIDLLSMDVLIMDLSHIKGKQIAEGDVKHLLNFLQILNQLSKLYPMQDQDQEDEPQDQAQAQTEDQEAEAKDEDQELEDADENDEDEDNNHNNYQQVANKLNQVGGKVPKDDFPQYGPVFSDDNNEDDDENFMPGVDHKQNYNRAGAVPPQIPSSHSGFDRDEDFALKDQSDHFGIPNTNKFPGNNPAQNNQNNQHLKNYLSDENTLPIKGQDAQYTVNSKDRQIQPAQYNQSQGEGDGDYYDDQDDDQMKYVQNQNNFNFIKDPANRSSEQSYSGNSGDKLDKTSSEEEDSPDPKNKKNQIQQSKQKPQQNQPVGMKNEVHKQLKKDHSVKDLTDLVNIEGSKKSQTSSSQNLEDVKFQKIDNDNNKSNKKKEQSANDSSISASGSRAPLSDSNRNQKESTSSATEKQQQMLMEELLYIEEQMNHLRQQLQEQKQINEDDERLAVYEQLEERAKDLYDVLNQFSDSNQSSNQNRDKENVPQSNPTNTDNERNQQSHNESQKSSQSKMKENQNLSNVPQNAPINKSDQQKVNIRISDSKEQQEQKQNLNSSQISNQPAQTPNRNQNLQQINFDQQFENFDNSLYCKLREEKMNYLKQIHRIIFELEKRKIIDEKQDFKKQKESKNDETKLYLNQIEQAYNKRIKQLQTNVDKTKKTRIKAVKETQSVINSYKQELKREKMEKIENLKTKWQQQQNEFQELIQDEGQLEKQIMELYKQL